MTLPLPFSVTIRQESKSVGEITCVDEFVKTDESAEAHKMRRLGRANTDLCLQKLAESGDPPNSTDETATDETNF